MPTPCSSGREPALHAGLLALRDRVRAQPGIRRHDPQALRDQEHDGIRPQLVPRSRSRRRHPGAPGDRQRGHARLRRRGDVPHRCRSSSTLATGLLFFHDLAGATSALPALVAAGFATIELMDATSLRVAQREPEAPDELRGARRRRPRRVAGRVPGETRRGAAGATRRCAEAVRARLAAEFARANSATMPARRAQLWHIRKGLYATVAGASAARARRRCSRTSPCRSTASTTPATRLTRLFEIHGYEDSVIFGHAKDGNIHFMLNERFDDPGRSPATRRSPKTWWSSCSARAAPSRRSTGPAGSWRRSCAASTATSCTR